MWQSNIDDVGKRLLTDKFPNIKHLSISPNGDSIVFPDKGDIIHLDLITLTTKNLTKDLPGSHYYPVCSPGGQHIYFTSANSSQCCIQKLNIQDEHAETIHEYQENGILRHLEVNPSGTRLYFNAHFTTDDYIFSLDLETFETKQYGKGLLYPAGFTFQKNGSKLAYLLNGHVFVLDENSEEILWTGISTKLKETTLLLLDDGTSFIMSDNYDDHSDMYLHNLKTKEIFHLGSGSWPSYHSGTGKLYYVHRQKIKELDIAAIINT